MSDANVKLVTTYLGAIEQFDVAAASALIDEAMVQTELPNKLYAKGQVRSKAEMMRDLPKGRAVLREQALSDRNDLLCR